MTQFRTVHAAIRALVVASALVGCAGPLKNPLMPDSMAKPIATEHAVEAPPPKAPAVAPAPDPFPGANSPDLPPVWMQPITFDPTGSWPGASSTSALQSPLWPMRASGDIGVPRGLGRNERENVAVGAVVGVGLFAAAMLHAFGVWH
jgi:hypothetical protein